MHLKKKKRILYLKQIKHYQNEKSDKHATSQEVIVSIQSYELEMV